jgi:hypothetical protein
MKQIRLPLKDLEDVVCQLALEQIKWADVNEKYPTFNATQETE